MKVKILTALKARRPKRLNELHGMVHGKYGELCMDGGLFVLHFHDTKRNRRYLRTGSLRRDWLLRSLRTLWGGHSAVITAQLIGTYGFVATLKAHGLLRALQICGTLPW